MAKINILDCTLRDGGYVNHFAFENEHIFNIVKQLQFSGTDIIECGFLDSINGKKNNSTRFDKTETLNSILEKLPEDNNYPLFVAMVDFGKFNVEDLPDVTHIKNEIKGIRLAFRKSDYKKIFLDAEKIIKKGYKLFIQDMVTELYSDKEILELIDKCNQLDIYAFYIVDTHGSLMREEFRRLYYLFEHNLKKNIHLGFHSHNNLQLSYSNAIDFIELSKYSNREIIIDTSIYGMGRGAGNLNTELLADYINKKIGDKYKINPLLEVVDEYLTTIHHQTSWGYSLEHFLSASEHCHPNYASFLINKKNLSILEIKELLSSLPNNDRREFNYELIEKMYLQYKKVAVLSLNSLPDSFYTKPILLIASGKSIDIKVSNIVYKIKQKGLQTVSLNHLNPSIPTDYVFFSNQVRYDEFCDKINPKKLIVTNNIKVRSNHFDCYVVNYTELFEYKALRVDNVAILAMNLLSLHHVNEVFVAGLDGYAYNLDNQYSYEEYNRVLDRKTLEKINNDIIKAIKEISHNLHISYITPSLFKQYTKQKIIGVIPSRYASTRLPGKPLKDIVGLPMIIHVLKRAQMSSILNEVVVATDDKRIYKLVEENGGKAIMTSLFHNNGSERMHEVSQHISGDVFVVINGDEALLNPEHIDIGVKALLKSDAPVSLLYNKFYKSKSPADFKVVVNRKKEIMYISRNDIPSDARMDVDYMYKAYHIMSFTKEFLDIYITLEQTRLDKIESHELLRVLEYGYKIQGEEVESSAISVDTPDDLEYVRSVMSEDTTFQKYGIVK